MSGSRDDHADSFELIGVQVHERDFLALAEHLDKLYPDPLKALMFASGYIGWAMAKMEIGRVLRDNILIQLPMLVTQVQMRVWIETRRKHDEQGEQEAPPQGPG